jgi:NADPH-dependent 2,4-dienoyl-CoA reductase/sulfur reductase-like enzyme
MSDRRDATTVAVIGAGPAGIRASEVLVRHGFGVVLIDEAAKPGGQIYRQPPDGAESPGEVIYGFEAAKAKRIHNAIAALGDGIDYRSECLVWNIGAHDKRFRLDLIHMDMLQTITVDRVIIATGAVDRVLPFPGWTLPGVFTLGAAQIALKSQGVAIGRHVALVGAGPLLPLLVHQYLAAGVTPVVVLDVTPLSAKLRALRGLIAEPSTLAKGVYYTAKSWLGGAPIQSDIQSIQVLGAQRVAALAYARADGKTHEVACDAVAASFGLRSETQLADLAGCRFGFDTVSHQWQPERDAAGRSSVPGIYLAGDGATIGGADVAELSGTRAALALVTDNDGMVDPHHVRQSDRRLRRQGRFRRALEAAYPFPDHLLNHTGVDTLICRCEGITLATLREAVRTRGPTEVNRLKAFTRIGMGRCQGRMCGHVAAELLARETGTSIVAAGRLRAQPPIKPLPLSASLTLVQRHEDGHA